MKTWLKWLIGSIIVVLLIAVAVLSVMVSTQAQNAAILEKSMNSLSRPVAPTPTPAPAPQPAPQQAPLPAPPQTPQTQPQSLVSPQISGQIHSHEFGPAVKAIFPRATISIPGEYYTLRGASEIIGFIQQMFATGKYNSYISARRSCDAANAIKNDVMARFGNLPMLRATMNDGSQTFLVLVTRSAAGVMEIYFIAPLSGRLEKAFSGTPITVDSGWRPTVIQQVNIPY